MKKAGISIIVFAALTMSVHALDAKYASMVNAALADLKTHTTLSVLKGHVAVNISSGNKELDKQFAQAIQEAYPNFDSKADSVHNEDLYQMRVKVYRENDEVFVRTTVTNFQQKNIAERTARAKTVSLAVLETLQYETAIHAKNEFEAYLDSAFADAGELVMSLRIFIIRGLAFFDENKYESALAEFNTVLELKPDDAEALYYIGHVYYSTEKYDTAIEYYTRALKIDPAPVADHWDAYLARGACYNKKEDYDRAIADFNQSEKLRPKDKLVFYLRGSAYFNKKDYHAAIADFTKSIALKSDENFSYILRGLSYRFSEEYDKAIKDYSQSIKLDPNAPSGYYMRAEAYAEASKYAYAQDSKTKKAIADCQAALKIDPHHTEARELLASLRQRRPKPSINWSRYLPGIDKDGYGYFTAGLVKNMDESKLDDPKFKYHNKADFVSFGDFKYIDESKLYSVDIGINALAGGGAGFFGGEFGVNCFLNEYKYSRVVLDGTFMVSLPITMSLFTIRPYAGIGFDMVISSTAEIDSNSIDSNSKEEIAKNIGFGVDYEYGIKLRIGFVYLSAAYRQRLLPSYKIEYITLDKTEELFLKRFIISVGFGG